MWWHNSTNIFVHPYDIWNTYLIRLETITFPFVILSWFTHIWWLLIISGIAWFLDCFCTILIICLNARKKHRQHNH